MLSLLFLTPPHFKKEGRVRDGEHARRSAPVLPF